MNKKFLRKNSLEVLGLNKLTKPGRELAKQHLYITITITFVLAVINYFGWGLNNTMSAIAGGCVYIIPNFIFAHKAFKYAGARSAQKVVDSFYGGVKLKMLVTAILFSLCFKFFELSLATFFITYFLTLLVPFIHALIYKFTFNQL